MQLFVVKSGKDPFEETYTNTKSAVFIEIMEFDWYFKDISRYLFNSGVTSIQVWEYRADEKMEMTLVNHRKALNLKKKPRILNPPPETNDVSKISQETKPVKVVVNDTIDLNTWNPNIFYSSPPS